MTSVSGSRRVLPLSLDFPALATIQGASVLGRVATGPRAGRWVVRLGRDLAAPVVITGGPRQARFKRFDLHANTRGERGRPDSARMAVPVRAAPALGAGLARADRRRQGVGEAASSADRSFHRRAEIGAPLREIVPWTLTRCAASPVGEAHFGQRHRRGSGKGEAGVWKGKLTCDSGG